MLIVQEPLERRRQLLAEAMKGKAEPSALSESLNPNLKDLVRVAKEFGFGGIVRKAQGFCLRVGQANRRVGQI
jgi:ATP-dependent DNA ligase